jgi:Domain of unknown function (DUF5666)
MNLARNVALSLLIAAFAATAHAQDATQKIAGEVVRFDNGTLRLKTSAGAEQTASVTDRTRVSVRGASDIAHVQQGSFIGVTAAPGPDGTLVASEIHIFPENMRGTGEGHRPLSGSDTMTNATVSKISGKGNARNSMTNATVENVGNAGGEATLTLSYSGGRQTIVVPRGTPVMTTDVGNPSELAPGAHVIVYGGKAPDGKVVAQRISVGKNGYTPPI